jgi:hypothetical protein
MEFCVCVACYWTCSGMEFGLVRVFLGRHSCYWKCQEVQSSPVQSMSMNEQTLFFFSNV